MKQVAIFFSHDDPEGPPFDNAGYRAAYQRLAQQISDRGALCTFVRSAESFLGSGTFSHGWRFASDESQERIESPIHANVVYNKGEDFQADAGTRLVNRPELDSLCRNKEHTYERFSSLMPATTLIGDSAVLRACLANVPPRTRVVIKPPNRWGGAGVVIDFSTNIQSNSLSYPLLFQGFVDTSAGIPGLCEGYHDLRCLMVNGVVAMSSIRIPPAETLMANIARGAEVRLLSKESVPEEPLRITQEVDRVFEQYGTRIYSVDMGRDVSGRWYIFELNPQPGLTAPHRGPQTEELYSTIADALIAEVSAA